jgi:hypothetical protein
MLLLNPFWTVMMMNEEGMGVGPFVDSDDDE